MKKDLKLEDLPGVGAATAEKLREAGYNNLISIAVASPGELIEISGLTEAAARKIVNYARDKLDVGFESGDDLLKKREQVIKITTGSKEFDTLIGGGLETGAITECYGAYGSGKTALAHQLAVNVQLPKEKGGAEGMAVWIDTEGTLRPERIKQIAEAMKLESGDILRNLRGVRAFNSDHQMLLAEKIEDLIVKENLPVKLVIVDSLMSHFRSEFCVTPDTVLIGNPKATEIKNFRKRDKVLTHTGLFRRVLSKKILHYKGELLNIKPCYGSRIKLTGDHSVLALKTVRSTFYNEHSNYKKKLVNSYILKKNIGKNHYKLVEGFGPDWIMAGTLEKGDYLVYPIVKNVRDVTALNISDYIKSSYYLENGIIKCSDFFHNKEIYDKIFNEYLENPVKGTMIELSKKYNIPIATVYQWIKGNQKIRKDIKELKNEVVVDNSFMRLLGYYLAEGSSNDHQFRFTFNSKEIDYINDVKQLIRKIFNIEVNKDIRIGKSTNVVASSRLLSEFFKRLVGKKASKKRLPLWVLYLPLDKQRELINGYWRGDGCRSKFGFQFDTASLVLAEQIKLMLARLGFIPTFRKVSGSRKNPKYVVEVFGERLKEFCDIVGKKHAVIEKRRTTYNSGWNDGNYLFLPIRDIKKEIYEGELYNLEIAGDHSYASNSCVLHNCGRGVLADRQQKLNKHMHALLKLAQNYNIAVYVTNQVMAKPDMFFGDPTEAIGGHVLAHASTVRLYLRRGKKGTRVAKLVDSPCLPDGEIVFTVTEEGIKDV